MNCFLIFYKSFKKWLTLRGLNTIYTLSENSRRCHIRWNQNSRGPDCQRSTLHYKRWKIVKKVHTSFLKRDQFINIACNQNYIFMPAWAEPFFCASSWVGYWIKVQFRPTVNAHPSKQPAHTHNQLTLWHCAIIWLCVYVFEFPVGTHQGHAVRQ